MKKFNLLYLFGFLLLTLFVDCTEPKKEPVQVTFSFGPENAGTLKLLIDEFNKTHENKIKVNYKEASRLSDEAFDQLATDFSSENYNVDVWGSDVVWTQTMASKGWAEDLTKRFFENFKPSEFVDASMNSVTYQSKVWALPWYLDIGVLFFRKDLLKEQKTDLPPKTWSELIPLTKKIMKSHPEVPYGYLFQTDAYEGGTVNACEYIWNAGGDIMLGDFSLGADSTSDPNIITVNSKEGILGLQQARKIFEEGLSKPEAQKFRELESTNLFLEGKSVFMRGWPTALSRYNDSLHSIKLENIGVSTLPVSKSTIESSSCIGGWNLMINAKASEEVKNAAWQFIQFLVSENTQKFRAEKEGTLPSLKGLYKDEELFRKAPLLKFANTVLKNGKNRPSSPYYIEMSPFISTTFHKTVTGETKAEAAVVQLEKSLNEIMEKR